MPLLSTTRRKVAGAAVAAAVLGGSGAAVGVTAGPSSPAPAVADLATRTAPAVRRVAPGWLRRADHVSAELRRHGHWVTVELDRGRVTAVSVTSITLRRPDGATVRFAVTPATKVRGVASVSAVSVGRPARVLSEAGKALRIGQHPARSAPSSGASA